VCGDSKHNGQLEAIVVWFVFCSRKCHQATKLQGLVAKEVTSQSEV